MSASTKAEPAAKGAKSEAADTSATTPLPAKPGGGAKSWLPVIAALLLAPAATWATVEYVLIPQLLKKFDSGEIEVAATPAAGGEGGHHGKETSGGVGYEFQNVVVNLAGTMGTRYLKTSFLVTGVEGDIRSRFESAKPKLTDVTLNVLSSLTLADLEEPGAKNVIREKLVNAYNQALGGRVAEQVYFSDFVIQ